MKIAILNITKGGLSKGYQKYLRNLISRLTSHPQISALLVGIPETIDFLKWERQFSLIQWILLKTSIWTRQVFDHKTKKTIEKFTPDVVFIPTARYYRFNGVPLVSMIGNMEPLVYSDHSNPKLEKIINWARKKEAYKSMLKTDRIIAISNYVKEFLVNSWNIPHEKIGLVYHGIELPSIDKGPSKICSNIPESLRKHFIFTAGSIRPARGLEDVILSLRRLMSQGIDDLYLVIAGGCGSIMSTYRKKLDSLIINYGLKDKVIWAGDLNEEEMSWCYQNCRIFIMTSRVEACPITALEAMSHGCISISANNPPLQEIFWNTAIYYSPKDIEMLAEAIRTVLAWDSCQCEVISEQARKRAAQFSWDVTVERTLAELTKAVESF